MKADGELAEGDDAEVDDDLVGDFRVCAEGFCEGAGEEEEDEGDGDAENEDEANGFFDDLFGSVGLARAEGPADEGTTGDAEAPNKAKAQPLEAEACTEGCSSDGSEGGEDEA